MGYEHHYHHRQNHNLHQRNTPIHIQYRNTFLPMLCSRPSIQDVTIPRPAALSSDPLSPRIGCMGQVKRNKKIVGYPASHRFSLTAKSNDSTTTTNHTVKYSKLKRLFSAKNVQSPNSPCTHAAIAAGASAFSSRSRTQVGKGNCARRTQSIHCRKENLESINIDEMDPPLPVIKKMPRQGEGTVRDTLWKRRSGGAALKSLQLNHHDHPPAHHPEATTV